VSLIVVPGCLFVCLSVCMYVCMYVCRSAPTAGRASGWSWCCVAAAAAPAAPVDGTVRASSTGRARLFFICALMSKWQPCECDASCSYGLFVCLSFRDLQPTTIDRSQPNLVCMDPCKPFWIPCLPYSQCLMEKYGKFCLFPTLNGCHLDIMAQIKKSRRESTRMSMDSIAFKY